MNKLLTTIFAVTLACAVPSFGQDEAPEAIPFSFTAPTTSRGVGTTFTVPLAISDVTGDGLISFQFDVVFDQNILTTSGPNFGCSSPAGTIAGDAGFSVFCNVPAGDPGRLKVAAFGSVLSLTGSGTLMNLTFTVNPAASNGAVSPLDIQSDMFFSNTYPSVPGAPHSTTDGQVTVIGTTAAPAAVTGRVLTQHGRPIVGARVIFTDSYGREFRGISSTFGYFTISNVAAGENYIVRTTAKGHAFDPWQLHVTESVTGLVITPN